MRKYIVSSVVAIVWSALIVNSGFAGPLTDYSPGKTALDISWMPNQDMKNLSTEITFGLSGEMPEHNGERGNYAWGLTTGLDGKWAVQYRRFNPESRRIGPIHEYYGMNTREVNVLYEVDKNLSLFAGWHQAEYTYGADFNFDTKAENKNVLQAGLTGTMQIAPKTQLYGTVGAGKDLVNYETGVSHTLAKNLEFNLFYRYKKVQAMKHTFFGGIFSFNNDVTAKGWGYGLTCKF